MRPRDATAKKEAALGVARTKCVARLFVFGDINCADSCGFASFSILLHFEDSLDNGLRFLFAVSKQAAWGSKQVVP